jgi:hypothetical protein
MITSEKKVRTKSPPRQLKFSVQIGYVWRRGEILRQAGEVKKCRRKNNGWSICEMEKWVWNIDAGRWVVHH